MSVQFDQKLFLLKKVLTQPLPGLSVQSLMSPTGDNTEKYFKVPSNAHKAGVLFMLYPKDNTWHTVFMKRTSNIQDIHSNQISLPGGRYEDADGTLEQCAIREAHEETGIAPGQIDIFGKLSPLYVYASNHLVHPFIGIISKDPVFIPALAEVQSLIEVPIDHFYSNDIIKYKDLNIRHVTLKDVPYYDLYGEVLWGATAMMMAEFIYLWSLAYE